MDCGKCTDFKMTQDGICTDFKITQGYCFVPLLFYQAAYKDKLG